MKRQERRRLERAINKPKKINKESIEYQAGVKEGIRQERARWIGALDGTKGIGDKLFTKVLDEVAKQYKGELL